MEREIKYCFQCHNSVYRPICKTNIATLWNRNVCLYCYRRKHYIPTYQLIGACRMVLPESADKLLRGVWQPNQAIADKPQ